MHKLGAIYLDSMRYVWARPISFFEAEQHHRIHLIAACWCAADAWYCPCCLEEGKSSSQQAPHLRFQQPHPAVQQSEYQQAALLLGRQEYSSCTTVSIMAHAMNHRVF